MNKIVLGLALILGTLVAQPVLAQNTTNKKTNKDAVPAEDLKKISSFIKNKVVIKETGSLSEIANRYGSIEEYQRATANNFMSVNSYQKFVESLYKMDPVEKIILNDTMGVTTPKEFKSLWKGPAQTFEKLNENGEPIGTQEVIPDIKPEDITSVIFYEEWKTDPLTLEMSKRVLAYSLVIRANVNSDMAYDKVLFTIVKDDAALVKLKDNFRN